jgi:DNA-binding transcriptional LysR family regulator
MEIRVLRYFLAVAREENITKAAEYLNITQPTLSRQLAMLEEETGTVLFQRGSRRIKLTEEGLLLRRRAEEIVSLADMTMEELRSAEDRISGTVTIGTGGLKANSTVIAAAESFRSQYPNVRFSVFTGTADIVQDRIDSGLADFGILLEPVSVEKYSFIRLKQKERWAVMVRRDNPLSEKQKITADDLKEQKLVFPGRPSVQSELYSWFSSFDPENNISYTSNLSLTAADIVMTADCAALILEGSLPYYDPEKLAVIPLSPQLESGTVLAYKRQVPLTPAGEKFLHHLKCLLGIE